MKKLMKKLFFALCMLIVMLTILPMQATANEESFNDFRERMKNTYFVDINVNRDTPLTQEEQADIELCFRLFGKDFVRTVSTICGQRYVNYDRLQLNIDNARDDALGLASGANVYLCGTGWDEVTLAHEFVHTIHQAAETISTGAEKELISELSEVNIEPYGTPWKSGDSAYYAYEYGKTNAKDDIATIVSRFTSEYSFTDDVKNGNLPVIRKKIAIFRDFTARYIGISPFLENILEEPMEQLPSEVQFALLTEVKTTLAVGETYQIKVESALPVSAPVPTLENYQSYNVGVAKVDQNGLITARQPGVANIYAQITGTKKYVSFSVVVTGEATATSLSFTSKPKATMQIGETAEIKYKFLPEGTSNLVTLSSSDPSIVSVDENGLVTAVSKGSTRVNVSLYDSTSYYFLITVTAKKVTNIIVPKELTLTVGESSNIKAVLEPADAEGTVKYSSSDLYTVTVNTSGNIIARKVGSATITVSVNNVKSTCVVTVLPKTVTTPSITPTPSTESNSSVVTPPVDQTSIQLKKSKVTMSVNKKLTLAYTVIPSNAKVTFSSSDKTVATVDNKGVVIAKKAGTAVIIAKVGKTSSTCTVTVNDPKNKGLLENGWYKIRCLDNLVNISNKGGAELRSNGTNSLFLLTHEGNNQYSIQTEDGKYLGASGKTKDGIQVKLVDKKYLWQFYSEGKSNTVSIRHVTDKNFVLNAAGQKKTNGTWIILWTYKKLDAPKHAEFKFEKASAPKESKS